ncbi:MAG: gliding motility-associated C-terminal domain-containing protein [Tannerella sp.]|nr:gliding motility-associated C-terminal domain-containing protein [Tannerella sp.]
MKKIRKSGWIFVGWLWASVALAQYQVSGGAKPPLLVADNTPHRIQVYLVYGMEQVSISYTSPSSSHQWYRYRTKALEAEPVSSEQQGSTSVVNNPVEGYGYFVMEGDNPATSHFIWLIDYSNYPVDIQNLRVAENADPCLVLRLDGTNLTAPLVYRTPIGDETAINRQYEISYMTQAWQASSKLFAPVLKIDTLQGNPFNVSLNDPPLYDTEIQLTGDLFARYFGTEKTFSIDFYQAVAIEVHADTLLLSSSTTNISGSENEILAPANIRFTAQANTPVASLFIWQVFRADAPDKPLVRLTEPEMEYMFDRVGEYTVKLEVSDRSGMCTNTENSYNINITETELLVPNAFTPEGSPGVNDEFRVAYKSVVRFQGWIFNRWGAELFRWSDPARGWDGKYRGKYVPAGAYFYVIEYTGTDGKARKKSGDVNVIRSTKIQNKTTP